MILFLIFWGISGVFSGVALVYLYVTKFNELLLIELIHSILAILTGPLMLLLVLGELFPMKKILWRKK